MLAGHSPRLGVCLYGSLGLIGFLSSAANLTQVKVSPKVLATLTARTGVRLGEAPITKMLASPRGASPIANGRCPRAGIASCGGSTGHATRYGAVPSATTSTCTGTAPQPR